MRRFYFILLICLLNINHLLAGDWKIYASYHNATQAVKTDARIFVLANGNLYSYDTEDQTVELYDKTNALSDCGIAHIAYSSATQRLVALYENGNIDLIGMNHTRWNMPDLKKKVLDDKTINELKVVGSEALISLNSGLVLLNLKEGYFEDIYVLGSKVTNATIVNNKIYAKTADGVFEGDRSQNLLDISNWKKVANDAVTFGQTAEELKEGEELLEKVKNIVPNSPTRNYAYRLNIVGERLLVAGGNPIDMHLNREGTLMKYEKERWINFDEEGPLNAVPSDGYMNMTDIVQDPKDPEHHFASSMYSGLYEFKNYQLVKRYSSDNSPITSILPNSDKYYQYEWITGLNYDPNGNLWLMNCNCDTVIRIIQPDGKWLSLYDENIVHHHFFEHTLFDRRGWVWITQWFLSDPRKSFLYILNTNGTLANPNDDKVKRIVTFQNQDGTSYTPVHYQCIAEDLNGAMWLGTTEGLFMSDDPSLVFNDSFKFTQVKVPRNDGSNLADYLLNGVNVKCIAIDGGNRKWVGTVDDGVYLISADGTETIERFTTENSPLISDEINDIAINGETGEVYIATTKGLCSYHGDATDPATSMSSGNLKVYPNPVRPEYQGKVHITGLMANSDVKIVSAAGKLVAEGTSIGGEFSWDCCMQNGKRVGSGIYYALCTDEEGKKDAVAKILIIK